MIIDLIPLKNELFKIFDDGCVLDKHNLNLSSPLLGSKLRE